MYKLHNKKKHTPRRRTLRKDATSSERILWSYLRNAQVGGYKFRRQHGIGPYIVDFYCSSLHFILEIDGHVHADRREYDERRQSYLEAKGCHVLRIRNEQVYDDIESVLEKIYSTCSQLDADKHHPA